MASTSIGTSHDIAQKIYRKGLIVQAERHWLKEILVGTSEDSAIVLQEEPSKESGDTVQIRFSPTEEQAGFHEDDTIEGNEAALKFHFQEFKIGYKAWAWSQRNQMSQQRVNIDIKKAAIQKAPLVAKRYFERATFAQLGGATYLNSAAGLTDIQALDNVYDNFVITADNLTAMNPATAIDSSHQLYAGGLTTSALVGADTTATMSLSLIDDLVEKAETSAALDYPIAPVGNLGYYVLVMSIEQGRQLRAATSSGDWADLQRALLEGGKDWESSEFKRGAFGIYNKTVLCTSDFLPRGVDSSSATNAIANTRRALFLGAKAGVIAYGQGYTDGQHLDWTEQIRDYKVWGVSVDTVWGCERTQFKNLSETLQTFGLLALDTYVKQ